jgi:hypothetical protein
MARHKEKDDEAGGEGLGRLQTRKKLWRDSTGAVVTKRRPEHEKRSLSPAPPSKRLKIQDGSSQSVDGLSNQKDLPTSPLRSINEQILDRPDAVESGGIAREPSQPDDLWPTLSEDAPLPGDEGTGVESYEFLCNASWGSQSQERTSNDILYNDFFAPDTGG